MRVKRVMYNADFGFWGWDSRALGPERPLDARYIDRYIKLVASTGADTFIMNPNTQRAWYPSKAIPTILDGYTRGDRAYADRMPWGVAGWEHDPLGGCVDFLDRFLELKEAGIDWFAETAAACRRYGMTPWASVRMNDMHGGGRPKGHYMNAPLYDDPEFRLKGLDADPANGYKRYYAAMDFGRREVRDYYFALIREIVEDYDYEGLQIDFMRNPSICDPVASPETVETITAYIAEIRALTQKRSAEIGKPYPLGLRVGANINMMKEIGLDVFGIIERGLVDYICPNNFVFSACDAPLDDIIRRAAGRCEVYGGAEWGANRFEVIEPVNNAPGLRSLYDPAEYLRGCAAAHLVHGCDGFELYNGFCGDGVSVEQMEHKYEGMKNIGDLELLRGKSKIYTFPAPTGVCRMSPFETCEQLPFTLEPSFRRPMRISMCAEPRGMAVKIAVVIDKPDDAVRVGVSFNGSWPVFGGTPTDRVPSGSIPATFYKPEHSAFVFTFDAERINEGWNSIDIYNGRESGGTFRVVNVDIAVEAADR